MYVLLIRESSSSSWNRWFSMWISHPHSFLYAAVKIMISRELMNDGMYCQKNSSFSWSTENYFLRLSRRIWAPMTNPTKRTVIGIPENSIVLYASLSDCFS